MNEDLKGGNERQEGKTDIKVKNKRTNKEIKEGNRWENKARTKEKNGRRRGNGRKIEKGRKERIERKGKVKGKERKDENREKREKGECWIGKKNKNEWRKREHMDWK